MTTKPHDILNFWFKELGPSKWFESKQETDAQIKDKFGKVHEAASKGELFRWRESPDGRLAEIIVLDQFSRNIHRGTRKAFENDAMALVLAQELISLKQDLNLSISERAFAYMPFMHSESKLIHEIAMKLFNVPGMEENYKFELLHKEIIDRFGRYPHRNAILGRTSTPEEIEFLKTHKGF